MKRKNDLMAVGGVWLHVVLAGFALPHASAFAGGVLGSKHDLSVAGPGPVRAQSQTEVCIFCHTPHRSMTEGPLWNHEMSAATYTVYDSPTMQANVGQPNGSSRLCLSCHDGTVAIGLLRSRPEGVMMRDNVSAMPVGPSNLGTDLSGHHPFSFVYDSALAANQGRLKDPSTLDQQVRLDHEKRLQCTSCHDPHHNDYGMFLVMPNTSGALCLTCHDMRQWAQASHSTESGTALAARSTSTASLAPADSPAAAVQGHSCSGCHAPHNAGSRANLLKKSIPEQNCFACHDGLMTKQNIQAEYNKFSGHTLLLKQGAHFADEDVVNPPRHVACEDCHDPHGSTAAKAVAPVASGALAGVRGVNAAGAVVDPIAREYELCFRCHGDSINRGSAVVNRVQAQTNTRLEFQTSSRSYHPVVGPGKNTSVPSLVSPLTVSSILYCTDCHNNDQGPNAGGKGPNGPHGSQFSPLLERALELKDHQPESPGTYALCYKCHSRSSILGDQSFIGHRSHVVEEKTACTTCHDPHGAADKPHLINFNRDYVSPNASGRLDYVGGKCFLSCHGKQHQ